MLILLLILGIQQLVLLTSCNPDVKKPNSSELEFDRSNEVQSQPSILGEKAKTPQLLPNLTALIPLTRENFKYWMPNELGNFRKINFVAGHLESMNVSGVRVHYVHQIFKEKQIWIEVVDGAGPIAPVFLEGVVQKLEWDYEKLKESGFSRIIERNGMRVWEEENESNLTSEMEFVKNGRFHFTFHADHLSILELREFVDSLPRIAITNAGFQIDSFVH